MSELAEIRERTTRIEVLLENSIKESKEYRDAVRQDLRDYRSAFHDRFEKQDVRLGGIERKMWQFTGAFTVLIGLWEVLKGKIFK